MAEQGGWGGDGYRISINKDSAKLSHQGTGLILLISLLACARASRHVVVTQRMISLTLSHATYGKERQYDVNEMCALTVSMKTVIVADF